MFQFGSLSDFIYMAGHGQYVWAAYYISLSVMILVLAEPFFRRKNIAKEINKQRHYDPIKKL